MMYEYETLSKESLLYEEMTHKIIGIAYEVMNELGVGFLEAVYHKALAIALIQNGFKVETEVPIRVSFRGHDVGYYKADLIIDGKIIIEVKVADKIIGEFKAQVINYLCASDLPVGLIINFGSGIIQTARLQHPKLFSQKFR